MSRSVPINPEALGRLLTVPEPWLASGQGIDFVTGSDWASLRLIEPQFPEAKPGDSGRQFWRLTELGRAVARGDGVLLRSYSGGATTVLGALNRS